MIKHIVMWKFKENTEKEQEEFLTGLNSLYGVIPEIKSMQTGRNIKENPEYDAVLIAEFESLEDLKKYKVDERHVKVSSLCKSIRTGRVAMDIEE